MSAPTTIGTAAGAGAGAAEVVPRNRRLWATLVLGQVACAVAVVLALAAWCGPGRWDVPPRTVPVDVLLLAMGVALSVLHRRTVTLPMALLIAASLFGCVIVYASGDVWPAAVVPVAAVVVQLAVCPRAAA